jgi:hypothetical protein
MASAAAPKPAQLPGGATKGHGLKGAASKSYSVVGMISRSADQHPSTCFDHPPSSRVLQLAGSTQTIEHCTRCFCIAGQCLGAHSAA